MCWIERVAKIVLWMAICLGSAAEVARVCGEEAAYGEPVLMDFYADWCAPCKSMSATVDAIAAEGFAVRRVNIDRERELAAQFSVTTVPTFVVTSRGKEVDRVVGPTSGERLKAKLRTKGTVAPTTGWRYEQPTGNRSAIVRVFCQESERNRSIGSGTLVRWGDAVFVLTARHVVKDARKIIVELHTKKTHLARIVSVDATWDCAVLELVGQPVDVEPATIELGPTALPMDGAKLVSCGYGPDGRLACSTGAFVGYRRSQAAPNGPDDWMVISGHARGGDSGGPVFNERGHVVGVLWGTDGREVAAVQPGRVHVTLDAALRREATPVADNQSTTAEQRAIVIGGEQSKAFDLLAEETAILQRTPTPPKPEVEPYAPLVPVRRSNGCGPNGCPAGQACDQTGAGSKAVLPWRGDAERRDEEQRASLDRLIELERLKQERLEREAAAAQANQQAEVKPEAAEPSPLAAGLCVLAAVVVGFVIYFATQKG